MKTKNMVSLETAKELKERGCDVLPYTYSSFYNPETYDLNEIITNGEMANAFFGEDIAEFTEPINHSSLILYKWRGCSYQLLYFLHAGKKEEAEKYLLEHCVFKKK